MIRADEGGTSLKLKILVEADADGQLYIHFTRERPFDRTVAYTTTPLPGLSLDFDSEHHLVGIDITDVQGLLGVERADPVLFDRLVGVKEAAEILGVAKPNFLRDYAARPGFPAPVADLASGRVWLLSEVVRFLKRHSLRPPSGSLGDLLLEYLKLKAPGEVARELGTAESTLDFMACDHRAPATLREEDLTRMYGLSPESAGRLLHRLNLVRELRSPERGSERDAGASPPPPETATQRPRRRRQQPQD